MLSVQQETLASMKIPTIHPPTTTYSSSDDHTTTSSSLPVTSNMLPLEVCVGPTLKLCLFACLIKLTQLSIEPVLVASTTVENKQI
ncbi:hypothetical protein AMECASPLE_036531 [Ameca splendens]|uniref:Uncharacterized protein n=1 Tax=Ameca splendens TaxID=208324 RepID=A0ABV0ZGX8_9TELE